MTTELRAWTNGDLDKIVTKTDGYWVEYSDGTRLLDVQSGNSAYILGYGNQEVLNSLNSDVNFVR
jgi:adenosylmethionine-8-amino-7-oxononanoate aminotransferase